MSSIQKIECTYGKKCYRLNPTHFVHNSHAHLENLISEMDTSDEQKISIPKDFYSTLSPATILSQVKIILSQKKNGNNSTASQSPKPGTSATTHSISPPKRARMLNDTPIISDSKIIMAPLNSRAGTMATKWTNAAPYHFFLTKIEDSRETHNEDLSISFSDLYDKSLGDLEASLQINFMIDIEFVMPYIQSTGNSDKPLLLLYETSNVKQARLPPNVRHREVKAKSAFGHHHTKMSLMYYKDKSLRVVVFTANLIPDDWKNYTQGVWISPACPEISAPNESGESPSGFKASLKSYLSCYEVPEMREWLERVKKADFSAVRVCLIASIPSSGPEGASRWGLGRLRSLLKQHVPSGTTNADWPLIVQCSSIGSLGNTPSDWLESQLKSSMLGSSSSAPTKTPLCLVYPSLTNVQRSHDGLKGGGCLPYSRMTHTKQLWLQGFMYGWYADARHRSRATPHIKTYFRMSPDTQHLAWFMLTSANLSKAAWGRLTQKGQGQNIMSYEAGVIFFPKLLIGKNVFEVSHSGKQEGQKFPIPFDLPLTQYRDSEKPWVSDYMLGY